MSIARSTAGSSRRHRRSFSSSSIDASSTHEGAPPSSLTVTVAVASLKEAPLRQTSSKESARAAARESIVPERPKRRPVWSARESVQTPSSSWYVHTGSRSSTLEKPSSEVEEEDEEDEEEEAAEKIVEEK